VHMIRRLYLPCLVIVGLVATLAGCATTSSTDHQFDPIPVAEVQSEDLAPVTPRAVADVLREAQENFEAANNAQESGDKEAALKYYTRMLELLSEANFDPAVFYNLRSEFKRILENSEEHAKLFDQFTPELRPGDVADRVSGDIGIEFPLSDRILAEIEEIQTLYPRNFQAGLDRSYKYLPYIRAELAKAGLPLDIAWLAMVESQFSPKVVSRAGAAGMWQFMRGTGARYGLRIDRYVDERFNWKKSTLAAARYLRDLNERFDKKWPLAVTAYNMGEGGMERAIAAAGGQTNLWQLLESSAGSRRMQRESQRFYPKFVASILVANSPEKFGFKSNPQRPEKTVPVKVKGSYSLAALDKACGLPEGTLRSLNCELVRGVTPPSGEFELAVPPEASARLVTALHKIPKERERTYASTGGATHTVRRGETLSGIADKYGVSMRSIMEANNLRSSHFLLQGKRLVIPGTGGSYAPSGSGVYTVKRGDTLYDIARANNVSIKEILDLNNKRSTRIRPGDKLVLSPFSQSSDGNVSTVTHVVKAGDNPAKIAQKYNVDLDDFLAWNKLSRSSTIHIGQKLTVRQPAAPEKVSAEKVSAEKEIVLAKAESDRPETAPAVTAAKKPESAAKEIVHVVAKGETPGGIAEKYNVGLSALLRCNNLSKRSVIHIGQKLKVPAGGSAPAGQPQPQPAKEIVHTVAKGDTPGGIADKYGVGLSAFLKYNNLTSKSMIRPGQKLKIPAGAAAQAASKAEPKFHVVAKGDNPSTIADRYHVRLTDLFKWNEWPKRVVLQIGEKVQVSQS